MLAERRDLREPLLKALSHRPPRGVDTGGVDTGPGGELRFGIQQDIGRQTDLITAAMESRNAADQRTENRLNILEKVFNPEA